MAMDIDGLRRTAYFAELPDEALHEVALHCRVRDHGAEELVLLEGEPSAGLGIVQEGRVRVYKSSPDGREQVLRILGAGRTFNDVAAFDGSANPASVATEEPSVVALLPREALLGLVETHPAVCRAAVAVLAGRLRAMLFKARGAGDGEA